LDLKNALEALLEAVFSGLGIMGMRTLLRRQCPDRRPQHDGDDFGPAGSFDRPLAMFVSWKQGK